MNKLLIICDRVMYGALLALVFVLPYSLALIAICQGIMIGAWILRRNYRPQGFNFFSSSMAWPLMAIGLLILLTIPFSHFPSLSARKLFTRFLLQILSMYLVTQIVHNRKRLYTVLAVLLLTLFVVALDIMIQYLCGTSFIHHSVLIFDRVTGPMNHPNDLGTLLVTVLPVVLVLVITTRKYVPWTVTVGIALLFLFLFISLGLTASRGAWIAFLVSMLGLGFCLKNCKLTTFIILMLVVFFGVFGIHCLSTRTDLYDRPVAPGSLPQGYDALKLFFNPSDRDFYWETAMGIIKHYPWFGCGYSAYTQTLIDLHVGHQEYPHNSLLHITAELGLVGLALYGWFFTALFLQIKNVLHVISGERDLFLLGWGISAGMLAWMIHGLMDTAWASLQLAMLWWIFMGLLMCLGFLCNQKQGDKPCR